MSTRDKGNSFANGESGGSGIRGYRGWLGGWQAPRPVISYEWDEGRHDASGL